MGANLGFRHARAEEFALWEHEIQKRETSSFLLVERERDREVLVRVVHVLWELKRWETHASIWRVGKRGSWVSLKAGLVLFEYKKVHKARPNVVIGWCNSVHSKRVAMIFYLYLLNNYTRFFLFFFFGFIKLMCN
jgi:hypothetical protein